MIIIFDIETTGLDIKKDRIVQIAGVTASSLDDPKPPGSFRIFIDPEMEISERAQKVHGITPNLLEEKKAKPFKTEIPMLDAIFRDHDLAGYNILSFDLPILRAEYERCGAKFEMEGRKVYDAFEIFKRFERRRLEDAYRFYCGKKLEGAHDALVDSKATAEVLLAQQALYKGAELCADPFEGKLVPNEDGALCFGFGKHEGKTLQDLANTDQGYLSWICDADFPPAVKQAVAEAKNGIFHIHKPKPQPESRFSVADLLKLEKKNKRLKELYASGLQVIRNYQKERDGLLDRVKAALLGIKAAEEEEVYRKEEEE